MKKYDYEKAEEKLYETFTLEEIDEIFFNDKIYKIILEYKKIFKYKKQNKYTIEEVEELFKQFYKIFKSGKSSTIEDIKEIIGTHGELLFYKQLLKEYDDNEIVWISREHSDIFGYDFLIYSTRTNEYILYEVKSTVSKKNFENENFMITENEYRKFNQMQEIIGQNIEYSYKIVNLLINDEKIIDQRIYSWNDDITELIERGYKISVEENKSTKSKENYLPKKIIKSNKKY